MKTSGILKYVDVLHSQSILLLTTIEDPSFARDKTKFSFEIRDYQATAMEAFHLKAWVGHGV